MLTLNGSNLCFSGFDCFFLAESQMHLAETLRSPASLSTLFMMFSSGRSRFWRNLNLTVSCLLFYKRFIPNITLLLFFGWISGEFGWAIVCILVIRSWAKIPMVRPNKPNMLPKHTNKAWLGIYHTKFEDICMVSVKLIAEIGTVSYKYPWKQTSCHTFIKSACSCHETVG